ncbi:potassium channel family protein [Cryptosporangium phraense]|uniref:Potassium transporter Kef n=1 Tax=Cryptosporangium phraense TaxID=2593070 RepID=A0A545AU62_9ACTN|nr:potassium channel protein [Cryptosporangium phraense]TQS44862.1 potassium transporter Kef [Cryptosporangium phraense]
MTRPTPTSLPRATVWLPQKRPSPLRALGLRLFAALALVGLTVAVVYIDRDGYHDNTGSPLSLLDAAYYSVVTLSTTGYGDIAPASPSARLVNVVFITPARVLFLIILVGTTLEVLTEQYRGQFRRERWRQTVKDHYVVCGYGTKGRSAVDALLENGVPREKIVVVERDHRVAQQAVNAGLAVVEGSSGRSAVLAQAHVDRATAIIVAPDADDAAVLTTLTARQLTNGQVRIVTTAREAENAPLLRQSGAHQVVVSSATAGRLLGLATTDPPVIDVVEDLLTPGHGMAFACRSVVRDEVGKSPRTLDEVVIAVVRRGRVVPLVDPETHQLETGDLLVYIRDDRPAGTNGSNSGD